MPNSPVIPFKRAQITISKKTRVTETELYIDIEQEGKNKKTKRIQKKLRLRKIQC